jgi:hypothetical protein
VQACRLRLFVGLSQWVKQPLRFLLYTTRRSLTLIVTRINWFTHSAQTSADTRRVFHPVKALVSLLRPSTISVGGRISFPQSGSHF